MADYYVNVNTGSDTNDGSAEHPWASLHKAGDTVTAGATVHVADGTYSDIGNPTKDDYVCYVRPANGGTEANPVIFKSTNRYGAVLDGDNYYTKHGFILEGDWITIDGFEMKRFGELNTSGGCDGAVVYGDHCTIKNCKIHDIGQTTGGSAYGMCGILAGNGSDYGVTYLTIENNLIYTVGRTDNESHDHGLYLDGTDHIVVKNNILYDCGNGWPIHFYSHASSNVKVLNNTFADPFEYTTVYRWGHILLACNVTTADIANNLSITPGCQVSNPCFMSYYPDSPPTFSGVVVRNNLIYQGVTGTAPSGVTQTGNIETTDPLCVDKTNRDYRLTSGSPCRDAGVTVSDVTDDYLRVSRPQGSAYDIGAYEYVEGGWASSALSLLLTATSISNVADNASSSPLTGLYVSLHTSDPGESGSQSTNEASYSGYARKWTERTTSSWTVSGRTASNSTGITFGKCSGSGQTITHFGIGSTLSGVGVLYYSGALVSTMSITVGDTPYIPANELELT